MNQILHAHVTYVVDNSRFYVQLLQNEAAKLQEELNAFFEKSDVITISFSYIY